MQNLQKETQQRADYADDEIDLRELFSVLWQGRWVIVILTGLVTTGTLYYALNLPNIYQAEAVLAPRTSDSGAGALSRLAAQYSGIAGLTGINLGSLGNEGKTTLAIETLKSREFFRKYLYEDILLDLMAVSAWDITTGELAFNEQVYDMETGRWIRKAKPPYTAKPSFQEAHKVFSIQSLSVTSNRETGYVVLAIKHRSPTVAKQWVERLIGGINDAIRERDVSEARRSIEFLRKQREETNLIAVDQVFAQLIEEQTKTIMLANASNDYVFQTVDPPVVPEVKLEPSRLLILMLGAIIGGILSTTFVLARHFLKDSR